MPTVKSANERRRRYAWMMKQIIEEKVIAAEQRLLTLRQREFDLHKIHKEYQRLYDLHIKPLEPQARQYIADTFEIRKLESFLQGQREKDKEFQAKQLTVEHIPYAPKSSVGKKTT